VTKKFVYEGRVRAQWKTLVSNFAARFVRRLRYALASGFFRSLLPFGPSFGFLLRSFAALSQRGAALWQPCSPGPVIGAFSLLLWCPRGTLPLCSCYGARQPAPDLGFRAGPRLPYRRSPTSMSRSPSNLPSLWSLA